MTTLTTAAADEPSPATFDEIAERLDGTGSPHTALDWIRDAILGLQMAEVGLTTGSPVDAFDATEGLWIAREGVEVALDLLNPAGRFVRVFRWFGLGAR